MKSYPRKQAATDRNKLVYNYRHSRARRTSENAFGIMSAYFRVFFTPIAVKTERVDNIIAAACILHNLLRDSKIPAPGERNVEENNLLLPEENLRPIASSTGRSSANATIIRDKFKDYFNGPGALSWQDDHIQLNY